MPTPAPCVMFGCGSVVLQVVCAFRSVACSFAFLESHFFQAMILPAASATAAVAAAGSLRRRSCQMAFHVFLNRSVSRSRPYPLKSMLPVIQPANTESHVPCLVSKALTSLPLVVHEPITCAEPNRGGWMKIIQGLDRWWLEI